MKISLLFSKTQILVAAAIAASMAFTGTSTTTRANPSTAPVAATAGFFIFPIEGRSEAFFSTPIRATVSYLEYESRDGRFALQIQNKNSSLDGSKSPLNIDLSLSSDVSVAAPRAIDTERGAVVRDRTERESLAEFLLRHLILTIDPKDMITVKPDRALDLTSRDKNILKIQSAYRLLKQAESQLGAPIDISPFNVFVEYTDAHKIAIKKIVVESSTASVSRVAKDVDPNSIASLLNFWASEMHEALVSRVHRFHSVDFASAQKRTSDVLRKNVEGRPLRVVGVDAEKEKFFLSAFKDALKKQGLELVEGFYYGSRVVPRTILAQIDPRNGTATMEMNKGKLRKDVVRESGLTVISDLEVLLVTRTASGQDIKEEDRIAREEAAMKAVRNDLNEKTRIFPIGLKILIVPTVESLGNQYDHVRDYLWNYRKWVASSEQFVSFYHHRPDTVVPRCESLFRHPF